MLHATYANVSPSNDTAASAGSTSEKQQGERTETIVIQSGVDSGFYGDTANGSPSRARSGPTQDDKPARWVESFSAKSCQSSRKAVADCSLDSGFEPIAIDTRPFAKETTPIPEQPAPISIAASREQPSILINHTQSSNEQAVVVIAETSLVSSVPFIKSS